MKYVPPPSANEEFRRIADAFRELEADHIQLTEQNAVPGRPQNGTVYYADGTNWNPGSGRGFYGYANGAFVFLG